jgi:predicted homoserine dehydrogenase-like protein
MALFEKLQQREQADAPIRVALIGAGKFGSMFLAQAPTTTGMHVAVIADLDPPNVAARLKRIGWPRQAYDASTVAQALAERRSLVTDDVEIVFATEAIDVVIECTGHVIAGVDHALRAFEAGKHVVMVNVEADALIGPLLARHAAQAGVVYSLANGDQPALICELVDLLRTVGFTVTCAGKGTKYLPAYHESTPDTVWGHYGFTEEQVRSGDYNAQMFNSFLDGTKSAIEMAAVANAAGLIPQSDGLQFPPSSVDDLPQVCRPHAHGGVLGRSGTVEVVSSLYRDGAEVERDLRWGVYVTFESDNDYVQRCFSEYGVVTDDSGRYAALYRPTHFIGLELGLSVAHAALRNEATGTAAQFNADVAAVAKRDLTAGELLDGEGGYTVYGQLVPAAVSLEKGYLPLGLSAGVRLQRPVAAKRPVEWGDIEQPESSRALELRRRMEREFVQGSL